MKLCISGEFLSYYADGSIIPFAESVRIAAEAGFECFDMAFSASFFTQEHWKEIVLAKKKSIAEAGLTVKYAHLPFDYPSEDDAEGWKRFAEANYYSIDMAKELGAECAAIHPYTAITADYDADIAFERSCEFLRPYCDYAKSVGLRLGVENMRGAGMSAPAKMRRFCTDINDLIHVADTVGAGICWDTGHGNISMQEQKKSLLKIGDRLTHVHVNDNFAEDDVHIIPFTGNVNWQEFIEGLKAIGYCGDMNLELSVGKKLPEAMRPAYVALMAAAGKHLISLFEQK